MTPTQRKIIAAVIFIAGGVFSLVFARLIGHPNEMWPGMIVGLIWFPLIMRTLKK